MRVCGFVGLRMNDDEVCVMVDVAVSDNTKPRDYKSSERKGENDIVRKGDEVDKLFSRLASH